MKYTEFLSKKVKTHTYLWAYFPKPQRELSIVQKRNNKNYKDEENELQKGKRDRCQQLLVGRVEA